MRKQKLLLLVNLTAIVSLAIVLYQTSLTRTQMAIATVVALMIVNTAAAVGLRRRRK